VIGKGAYFQKSQGKPGKAFLKNLHRS